MTKLREIADKLGLPIEKEFKFDDDSTDFIFKILDNGDIVFFHKERNSWVLSAWTLEEVYTKGYVLIENEKENKNLDEMYLTLVLEMTEAFIRYQEDLLNKTNDIITISKIKRQDSKVKFILEETKKRLLNK